MPKRTAVLVSVLILGLVGLSAFASSSESREDFLIRQQVAGLQVDGPDVNGPDLVPPDLDPPDVEGPNIDVPTLDLLDVLVMAGLAIFAGLVLLALLTLVRRRLTGRHRRTTSATAMQPDPDPLSHPSAGDPGWAAFERFLYELLRDPDSARAIRVAMRYAEGGIGRVGPRQADETPNEWVRRTSASQPDLLSPLTELVSPYSRVRFAGRSATPADRDASVNALRTLARKACTGAPPAPPSTAAVP